MTDRIGRMAEPKRYDKRSKREYSKAEDRVTALLQAHLDKLDLAHGQEGNGERSDSGRQG